MVRRGMSGDDIATTVPDRPTSDAMCMVFSSHALAISTTLNFNRLKRSRQGSEIWSR